MKTFALIAILAVFASAQDEIPNIDELLDNREGDSLISPAPDMGTDEKKEEGSDDPRQDINEDLQAGLDWVQDLYKTFCSGGDDKDGGETGDIDLSKLKPEEIASMVAKGEITNEMIMKWQAEQQANANGGEANGDMMAKDEAAAAADEWATDSDAQEAMADWADIMAYHAQICDSIKEVHGAVQEWNHADPEKKQAMEAKLGEEIQNFLEDFFEGAIGSVAVAGTALAAGVALLAV